MKRNKSILTALPTQLAFLAACVREMIELRADYQSPVDPAVEPEQARDIEIEQFLEDDMRILGTHLRDALPADSSDEFCAKAVTLNLMLSKWLRAYEKRYEEREVMMLFSVVGLLSNPYPYYKRRTTKPKKRVSK